MKECDLVAISGDINKSLLLIDKASSACVKHLYEDDFDLRKCLIVCGGGNNGADGFAIAKKLHQDNYSVTVLVPDKNMSFSNEAKLLITDLDTEILEFDEFVSCYEISEFTTIVDALFGIGLSRNVDGKFAQIIDMINKSQAKILSVDIPSGISSDNGAVMKAAVNANVTVTFACLKVGQLFYPGRTACGKLCLEDIGIPPIEEKKKQYCTTDVFEKNNLLPMRKPDGNKGTFGKALVIAGSRRIFGAAYLAAMSAYKCGCGMVHILTERHNAHALQLMIPEAILHFYDEDDLEDAVSQAQKLIDICDVICAGPGLDTVDTSVELIKTVVESEKPLVLDADALNIISKMDLLDRISKGNCIITPHVMEMSRLTGVDCNAIKSDPINIAKEFACKFNLVLALKDAVTVVASKDQNTYINRTGNCGMAKAGSGDVLAGIIAGLVAQKQELYKAACLGVYIHGLIGDRKIKETGEYGLMARNLIDGIGELTNEQSM